MKNETILKRPVPERANLMKPDGTKAYKEKNTFWISAAYLVLNLALISDTYMKNYFWNQIKE